MTDRDHERAQELIAQRGTEDIAAADESWLASHLDLCSECAEYAADFEQTGRWLQSVAITASPSLVRKTQVRVRERALYLQERQARTILIGISFCIGVLSSALSGWLWWKFGAWVAARLGVSSAIVEPGVLLFLVLPALVVAGLLLRYPQVSMFEGSLAKGLAREREGENQ